MQATFIKSITLTKKNFAQLFNRIDSRYFLLKKKDVSYSDFLNWSLVAIVLGFFTSFGDRNSTEFFVECLKYNYLPKVKIMRNDSRIKINICICRRDLDERKKLSYYKE